MNAPITVNGFSGDAFFSRVFRENRISAVLVENISKYRGEDRRIWADVPIQIGSKNCQIDVEMVVMYRTRNMVSEVEFGCPFMDQYQIEDEQYGNGLNSPVFGKISRGIWRPFRKITRDMEVDGKLGRMMKYDDQGKYDRRVILLLDMDAFEVQVHQQDQYPGSIGLPTVVAHPNGRIVAVSYEAKQLGISRDATPFVNMAIRKCEDLEVIHIPERSTGRIDTSITRRATRKIVKSIKQTLSDFRGASTFQFSSQDEFYVDVTDVVDMTLERSGWWPNPNAFWNNTYLYNEYYDLPAENRLHSIRNWIQRIKALDSGYDSFPLETSGIRLLHGAILAKKIIQFIRQDTGYQSSVGVATNKLIAKLASGLRKPGSVTVVLPSGFTSFSQEIDVSKIPGLGGAKGSAIKSELNISTMDQLQNFSSSKIADVRFQNCKTIGLVDGLKFAFAAHGFCLDVVKPKNCFGTASTTYNHGDKGPLDFQQIDEMMEQQLDEMAERIFEEQRENHRRACFIKIKMTGERKHNFTLTVPPYISTIDKLVELLMYNWRGLQVARNWTEQIVEKINMEPKF